MKVISPQLTKLLEKGRDVLKQLLKGQETPFEPTKPIEDKNSPLITLAYDEFKKKANQSPQEQLVRDIRAILVSPNNKKLKRQRHNEPPP